MNHYKCSCFCGSVQFDVELKNFDLTICHCSMCRKLTGSTGFASLEVGPNLSFIQKEGLVRFASSTIGQRGFCNQCGTSLFYRYLASKEYFVPPGIILDLPEDKVRMVEEIYYDNKPCYYEYANQTKKKLEADFNE